MIRKTIRTILILFTALFFLLTPCLGQNIKLKDVVRFEFTTKDGGMSNGYRIIEVIPDSNNTWKSYQTHFVGNNLKGPVNDVRKIFIKDVSGKILDELLKIIAKQDTGINMDLFKISKDELIAKIDTTALCLQPKQKKEFITALGSKTILQKELYKVLHPMPMDDKTALSIAIITKTNVNFKITAETFANLYDLPWHINKIDSYNPDISSIFAFVSGNNKFPVQQRLWLDLDLDKNIYWDYFQTRFNWDNLRADQPEIYSILKDTFKPVLYSEDKFGAHIYLKSALLPGYMQIIGDFRKGDTANVRRIKRYEDTILNKVKKGNFILDYLQTRPDAKMILMPERMGNRGKYIFRDIKKYYPAIDGYDPKQSLLLQIYGNKDIESTWILLPDNTLILTEYFGAPAQDGSFKFMNIDPQLLNEPYNKYINNVCVVFDASGKLIFSNKGMADIVIY